MSELSNLYGAIIETDQGTDFLPVYGRPLMKALVDEFRTLSPEMQTEKLAGQMWMMYSLLHHPSRQQARCVMEESERLRHLGASLVAAVIVKNGPPHAIRKTGVKLSLDINGTLRCHWYNRETDYLKDSVNGSSTAHYLSFATPEQRAKMGLTP